jgi:hypothetical protein
MPIVLAAQEAEMRRITVRSQVWASSLWDCLKKRKITQKKEWLKVYVLGSNPHTAENNKNPFQILKGVGKMRQRVENGHWRYNSRNEI